MTKIPNSPRAGVRDRAPIFRSGVVGPTALPAAPCTTHLKSDDLAERWGVTKAALAKQRLRGDGCRFLKLGRRVVYRLSDVEAFERASERRSTSDTGPDLAH